MSHRLISITSLFLMFFVFACASNKATIMLQATNCPSSDIVMKPTASILGGSQSWSVQFKVKVLCRDSAVSGAKIRIKYSWLPVAILTTNAQGIANTKQLFNKNPMPHGTIVMSIKTSNGVLNQAISY